MIDLTPEAVRKLLLQVTDFSVRSETAAALSKVAAKAEGEHGQLRARPRPSCLPALASPRVPNLRP